MSVENQQSQAPVEAPQSNPAPAPQGAPEGEGDLNPLKNWMDFLDPDVDLNPAGSQQGAPQNEPATTPAQAAPETQEPAPLPAAAAGQPGAESPTAPAAQAPTAPPSETEILRGQLAETQRLLAGLMAQQQTTQPAGQTSPQVQGQPQAQPAAQPEIPAYSYQLNPQLVEDMAAEDAATRSRALSSLIASLGQAIHRQVVEDVMTRRVPAVLAERDSAYEVRERQAQYQRDYYGTFPAHNTPEVIPMVAAVTQQVLRETGATAWTPQLRDAIGVRVNRLLATPGQGGAPTPAPTSPTPQPPAIFGGKRTVTQQRYASADAVARDIAATFDD